MAKTNIPAADAAYVILHGLSMERPCLPIDKAMKLTHERMQRLGLRTLEDPRAHGRRAA